MSFALATHTDVSCYRGPSEPASSASSPLASVRTSVPHAENSNTSHGYMSQSLSYILHSTSPPMASPRSSVPHAENSNAFHGYMSQSLTVTFYTPLLL